MAGEPSNVTGSRGVKLGLVVYLGSCRRRAPSWEQLRRQAQFQGGPAQLSLSKARPLGPSPPTRPARRPARREVAEECGGLQPACLGSRPSSAAHQLCDLREVT